MVANRSESVLTRSTGRSTVHLAPSYFLGFGAMCLGVKEGEYPPPADVPR